MLFSSESVACDVSHVIFHTVLARYSLVAEVRRYLEKLTNLIQRAAFDKHGCVNIDRWVRDKTLDPMECFTNLNSFGGEGGGGLLIKYHTGNVFHEPLQCVLRISKCKCCNQELGITIWFTGQPVIDNSHEKRPLY